MDNIESISDSSARRQPGTIVTASEPTVERVRRALHDVIDAERGINIVDLGLVYRIEIINRIVRIAMTMTAPGCPAQRHILSGVRERLMMIPGVGDVDINLVWEPRWSPQKMLRKPASASAGRGAHRD
ncbi:MAG: metal-sulfur cluster assembly factor [Burkholderiales bacterium]